MNWTELKRAFLSVNALESQLYPALKLPVELRTYEPSDFEGCVRIYRENEPGRFPAGSFSEFERYLEDESKTLIVAEVGGSIVGMGGIFLAEENVVVLCFGIVAKRYQRQRIGATLTLLRLTLVPEVETGTYVVVFAVPESIRVYRKFGFETYSSWQAEDGKSYPTGVAFLPHYSRERIRFVLGKRRIRVRGHTALSQSKDFGCRIIDEPDGTQRLEFVGPGDDTEGQ